MLFDAAFGYKAFVLRAAGIVLIGLGLFLKGLFLLVQTFGPDWLLFAAGVGIGIPVLWLGWIGWTKGQSRVALFFGLATAAFIFVLGRAWFQHLPQFVRDPSQSYADFGDYISHPGDITVLWRARKYKVKGPFDTGTYLSNGVKITAISYGGDAEVKVGKQSCQSSADAQQDCEFPISGELVLDSKHHSQTYLKITNPEP